MFKKLIIASVVFSGVALSSAKVLASDELPDGLIVVEPEISNFCSRALVAPGCVCIDGAFGSGNVICPNNPDSMKKGDFVPWPWS